MRAAYFYSILILLQSISVPAQHKYYVSPTGSDTAMGDALHPLKSISFGFRKIREYRRLHPTEKGDHQLILQQGIHTLSEPIFLRPEDSGTPDSKTIVTTEASAIPIISGAVEIKHWKQDSNKRLWVADVSGLPSFRQLWVNDQKAIRAQDAHGDSLFRIYSWNKKDHTVKISSKSLKHVVHKDGLELFIHQWWAIANLRISSYKINGDTAEIWFKSPEERIQSEHPWPAPWISQATGNSAYTLVNDIRFLDEPGEWYHDVQQKKLFYYPRKGEQSITAYVPILENLVVIQGDVDEPVKNIEWQGITFSYATWNKPSVRGHVPHQIGMHMVDAYRLKPVGTPYKPGLDNVAWVDRPAAAIDIAYASGISFTNCVIKHVGSTGIDFHKGVKQSYFNNGLLKDVGGNGILSGIFSPIDHEIHKPFNPKDQRDVNVDILIENNLLSNIANEDWSCVGIALGFQKKARVLHNEIEQVSYTGISMGWGWNPDDNPNQDNQVLYNAIHHYGKHNYDCAGIYNLGKQKNGLIAYNYIDSIYKARYAHLPTHWFYLYADEGSSDLTLKQNWTPTTKYLQNANGPNNSWIQNGPAVADSIKSFAGLRKNHQYANERFVGTISRWDINAQREELIELKFKDEQAVPLDSIKLFLNHYAIDTSAVYKWKNHVVLYFNVVDISVLEGRLQQHFPEATVTVFHDLFYQFDQQDCGKTYSTNGALTHYILTANMKADPVKQAEYIRLHDTQREYWPEVANGFCKAEFQRLQLFKNGRQLMLVISIPKGRSLEDWNPKTTENNPRMIQWNNMMTQFQEGLPDAPAGQTWLFLNK